MSARNLLYLHGLASGPLSVKAATFVPRLQALGYDVAIPDLNEGDFRGLTTTRAVELARRHLRKMPQPALVMGSSFGGRVACHAAALEPERVHALVLMAPALNFSSVWARILTPVELARWKQSGELLMDHPAHDHPVPLGYRFYEDAAATEAPIALPPALPVLVLHGRRDEVVPLADSEAFVASHPAARLVVMDSDHSMNDVLDHLWEAIERFVSDGGFA